MRKDKNKKIEDSVVINDFLAMGNFKEKTKWTYKSYLKKYFEYLKVNPDEYFKNGYDLIYQKDIVLCLGEINDKSPSYRRGMIVVIQLILEENDIELPNKFWRKIKRSNGSKRAITDSRIPTPAELKQILQHGELKARALFLAMSSSGMRVGETVQLKISDIDLNNEPARIFVPAHITKTDTARVCFISNEARDVLKEWLFKKTEYIDDNENKHEMTSRDYFLKVSIAKCNIPTTKTIDDDRVFPFTPQLARKVWNRLLQKSGFDEIDKRSGYHKIHLHCLRKYFRTYSKMRFDVVEQLMGHEGNLQGQYRIIPEDELAKEYLQAMNNLMVFETHTVVDNTEDVDVLKKQIVGMESTIKNMQLMIDNLTETIDNLYMVYRKE